MICDCDDFVCFCVFHCSVSVLGQNVKFPHSTKLSYIPYTCEHYLLPNLETQLPLFSVHLMSVKKKRLLCGNLVNLCRVKLCSACHQSCYISAHRWDTFTLVAPRK